jgi:CO/xanthine dehydrogenase FAD-binding subunit
VRYVRPNDLDEAVAAVAEGGLPLAGGSVLVPLIARGDLEPGTVVDVGRLAPLRELRDGDGALAVGSAVTLTELEGVEPAGEAALPEAAGRVGNPIVRRVATVGGNVASRLQQADLAPALLALDATVTWVTAAGEGSSPVADVLAGGAGPGRLLLSVRVGRNPSRRSGFVKFAWRQATGTAVASVAFAALDADGAIAEPRLAVGALAEPRRLGRAELLLAGHPWGGAPVEDAAAVAAEEAAALPGLGDPDDTRPQLVALGVRRLLQRLGAR